MSFSRTPDVCLLMIFGKIPLRDLFCHVNLVCRRWNLISQSACYQRRRLVLGITTWGEESALESIRISDFTNPLLVDVHRRYREDSSLIIVDPSGDLNYELIGILTCRLPNITRLEVDLSALPVSFNDYLISLITFWKSSLVTLKLFTWYTESPVNIDDLSPLHSAIGSLPLLRHLTYVSTNKLENAPTHFPIQCPSLKQFYFDNWPSCVPFFKIFFDYIKSDAASGLTQIGLCSHGHSLEDYLPMTKSLASKFDQIVIPCQIYNRIEPIGQNHLEQLAHKFVNLTKLSISIGPMPIDKLSHSLSRFAHLSHIELRDITFRNRPQTPITQLPRIKTVNLTGLIINAHSNLSNYFPINSIFPNLEYIDTHTEHYRCSKCHFSYMQDFKAEMMSIKKSKKWIKCIEAFLAPLKQCAHLKIVKHSNAVNGFYFAAGPNELMHSFEE